MSQQTCDGLHSLRRGLIRGLPSGERHGNIVVKEGQRAIHLMMRVQGTSYTHAHAHNTQWPIDYVPQGLHTQSPGEGPSVSAPSPCLAASARCTSK